MHLNGLRAVESVARCGSLVKAAAAAGLTAKASTVVGKASKAFKDFRKKP